MISDVKYFSISTVCSIFLKLRADMKDNVSLSGRVNVVAKLCSRSTSQHYMPPSVSPGQFSCISFPSHEEEFLRNTVGAAPYILVLGQDCAARYQLLNCLLGERLLPLGPEAGEACEGVQGTVCKRRKLCFTHGRQTRLSLALPGQYELVHQLAANCGRWDTVPREDLEIHEECEDPAHRLAELEITLHHPLLQVG